MFYRESPFIHNVFVTENKPILATSVILFLSYNLLLALGITKNTTKVTENVQN